MAAIRSTMSVLTRALLLLALLAAQFATAGTQTVFSLGNRVWFDTDNSGTINGTEQGINGVTVNLYGASDLTTIIASTTTANNGYYLFTGLAAGNYVVAIAASNFAGTLSGYWPSKTSRADNGGLVITAAPQANSDIDSDNNGTLQTSGPLTGAVISSAVTLGPGINDEPTGETDVFNGQGGPDGQGNMTVDFGFYTMTLGNLVWNDQDNDGLFDNGESGFDGVTVELRSGDGSALLATTTTSGGGIYTFPGLAAGNYIVRLPASNFNPAGILRDYRSSTGPLPAVAYEPAPDPNTNKTDSDDNGTETNGLLGLGGYIQAAPVTLTPGAGQSKDDTTGKTTENRVDFGVNNLPQLDLSVTITDGQTTYAPGGTLTYTVVVTNNGPADANGMTVNAQRPASIVSWTWACAAGTPAGYNCTNSAANTNADFTDTLDLPQAASLTYTVSANVATSANGPLTTSVFVVPPPGLTDLTNGDNIASDTDQRITTLDVSVSVTDGQATYAPAGTLTYTVVVTNNGPGDANGTTVSDTRPAQISSWSWACAPGTPAPYNCTGNAANPATFTDSVDLPYQASVTYIVTAQVAAVVAGNLVDTITVSPPAGFTDSVPGNNSATDTDVLATTTLSIAKNASPGTVKLGDAITYTIDVSNTGAVNATTLVVTDTLPGGALFQSASGTGWTCGYAAGIVTCTRDLLAPGAAPTITIIVKALAGITLTNVAVVTAGNVQAAATASAQTVVIVPLIPTMNQWGLALLGLLLAAVAGGAMRRRRSPG